MFEVFLSNAAQKSLKNLDKRIVERAKKALLTLKTSPLPIKEYDIKKLSGEKDTYRLRISRYRIVYDIDWDNKAVTVIKIDKRDEKTYSYHK
ncbi:MAG: type II toxin-antitoxin system RelE/ParE family toxin [Candidatus Methanoperedens sp.]|nr:type II toxin-antitoxin system RelE/ParE family toxin [Candidatus Methanoperedens sp.]